MGKTKCWACGDKHYPPTGKNCKIAQNPEEEAVTSVSVDESLDEQDSPASQVKIHKKARKSVKNPGVAVETDSSVQSHYGHGDTL